MLLSVTEFIGRFHPVIVHLPIGILLLALFLQWLSTKEQYRVSHDVMKVIWLAGFVSALFSCITGYLLSLSGDYDETTAALHMWMGIGVAIVSLIIFAKVSSKSFDLGYKISLLGLLVLIFVTGHLGGSLTHGDDYLTSSFTNKEDSIKIEGKIIPNIQEANVYADVVQPMLQARCVNCHGPKKQKGKLRLDNPEWIMKGGKDELAVVQGKPGESEMIKRLLLPREDEDHMPPKNKPQLNERQIAILHWWVAQGADFTKKIKELPQDEKIKSYLLTLQGSPVKKNITNIIPPEPIEKANAKDVEALKEKGVIILPVAQTSNYLSANFVNWPDAGNKEMNLLLPVKKQLVWLKLGDTKISDEALPFIAQCSNLTFLQLNGTDISDAGIGVLKALSKLQSLNLVNTKITAKGIMQLAGLKNLQSIYLYHSKVDSSERQQLKKIFPKTTLDFGGYNVSTLASDTTIYEPAKTTK